MHYKVFVVSNTLLICVLNIPSARRGIASWPRVLLCFPISCPSLSSCEHVLTLEFFSSKNKL